MPDAAAAVCYVQLESVGFKLSLSEKHVAKSLAKAVIVPFLTGYNKSAGKSSAAEAALDDIASVTIDGGDKVIPAPFTMRAKEVLGGEEGVTRRVVLRLKAPAAAIEQEDEDDDDDDDGGLTLEGNEGTKGSQIDDEDGLTLEGNEGSVPDVAAVGSGAAISPKHLAMYKTLGVEPGASEGRVKIVYRKLVKTAHPDRGGDPEIFRKIQAAYEGLIEGEDSPFRVGQGDDDADANPAAALEAARKAAEAQTKAYEARKQKAASSQEAAPSMAVVEAEEYVKKREEAMLKEAAREREILLQRIRSEKDARDGEESAKNGGMPPPVAVKPGSDDYDEPAPGIAPSKTSTAFSGMKKGFFK